MSVHEAGYRPSTWGAVGDHESRIRKLEAVPANTPPTTGKVIGWLAADVDRGSNALFDSTVGTYPYHADWDNAVTDSAGEPCGTLTSAAGLTLPEGNFQVWFSAWATFPIRPHLTWTLVSSSEVRYVQSSTSDATHASYVGSQTVYTVLTGTKVLTCGVDTFGGGDPTSDALVTMYVVRFS